MNSVEQLELWRANRPAKEEFDAVDEQKIENAKANSLLRQIRQLSEYEQPDATDGER